MPNNWEISDEEFLAHKTGTSEPAAEEFASFGGYAGYEFQYEVQQVADVLFDIHGTRNLSNEIIFGFDANSDGEIGGASVGLPIKSEWVFYLNRYLELKQMTDDREATGIAAALSVKTALMDAYGSARRFAEQHGLIDVPEAPAYSVGRAHLERVAGRVLSDEEVARFSAAMPNSTVDETISAVLASILDNDEVDL